MRLTEIYQCFCDETRLRILNLLTSGPLCVCHFQDILQLPQVKVSKHLAYLREHNTVESYRDQNWMVYSLPKAPTRELLANLRCLEECRTEEPIFAADMERLQKLLPEMRVPPSPARRQTQQSDPARVLFLCTGNSARSILAEYLIRKIDSRRFESYSAGAAPRKHVNPLAVRTLQEIYGIDASGAKCKSWKTFHSVPFDFVISLCMEARNAAPRLNGDPISAHWQEDDPAAFEGTPEECYQNFIATAARIETQLQRFAAIPLEQRERLRLEHEVRQLGTV